MTQFVYDIETLSLESTAVVLSASIVFFGDLDTDTDKSLDDVYASLLDRCVYVKFSAQEQIMAKRHISKSTLEWWKKQDLKTKELAFNPSPNDVTVANGMKIMRDYIAKYSPDKFNTRVWTRGSLDQLCTDSLCNSFGVEPLTNYGNYRDVRTAIELVATKFHKGYCDLNRPFNRDLVQKHHPSHDCCYDAMMLTYAE